MLYLIRNKETKQLLYETQIADSAAMAADRIYPDFDPATMEMGYWPNGKDSLPDTFTVGEDGAVRELSLDEKIEQDLITFGEELIEYLPLPTVANDETEKPIESTNLALVQMALEKKLIRSTEHCETALAMLEREIEGRVMQRYPPGAELKLVKECLDWVLAGQPAEDTRHLRYQQMNVDINAIKDEYKAARAAIKMLLSGEDG